MKKIKNQKFSSYLFQHNQTNKEGIVSSYLPWLLIATAILAIILISIFILKEGGVSLIDQLKNLLRLR